MPYPPFIAVNWGSTNFRAHYIDETGSVADTKAWSAGILKLDRDGMIETLEKATADWSPSLPIYLNGMITSNVGWEDIPYVQTPCSISDLCRFIHSTQIGSKSCNLIPGISCRNDDGNPDILRGEEIEIFGALGLEPELAIGAKIIALPGTHTKWVEIKDGRVVSFFTSMVGEIFDHLSKNGLLSSVIQGYGEINQAFLDGVQQGKKAKGGLGRLLFGVRAKYICGDISQNMAASYARGIMIGTEISDAIYQYPTITQQRNLHIIGAEELSSLYLSALRDFGIEAITLSAKDVTIAGYRQIHQNIEGV